MYTIKDIHLSACDDSRIRKRQFEVRFRHGDEHQQLDPIVIIQNATVGHLRISQTFIIIIIVNIMAVVTTVGRPTKE